MEVAARAPARAPSVLSVISVPGQPRSLLTAPARGSARLGQLQGTKDEEPEAHSSMVRPTSIRPQCLSYIFCLAFPWLYPFNTWFGYRYRDFDMELHYFTAFA